MKCKTGDACLVHYTLRHRHFIRIYQDPILTRQWQCVRLRGHPVADHLNLVVGIDTWATFWTFSQVQCSKYYIIIKDWQLNDNPSLGFFVWCYGGGFPYLDFCVAHAPTQQCLLQQTNSFTKWKQVLVTFTLQMRNNLDIISNSRPYNET